MWHGFDLELLKLHYGGWRVFLCQFKAMLMTENQLRNYE